MGRFELLSDLRQLTEKSLDKGTLLRIRGVAIAVIGALTNQIDTLLYLFKPFKMAFVQFLKAIK